MLSQLFRNIWVAELTDATSGDNKFHVFVWLLTYVSGEVNITKEQVTTMSLCWTKTSHQRDS